MASTISHDQSVNLTKTVIDKTPLPQVGQLILRDAKLKGFGVRILPSGSRSFIFEKRVEGRVRRMTIGKYGELTCEQARKQATKLAGQLAMGGNPIADRQREKMLALTLEQVFADFVRVRPLKDRTLYDYRRLIEVAFAQYKTRPLTALTKGAALQLHRALGQDRGEAYANLAMRFLRSLFNFAIAHYEDGFGRPLLTDNPVHRITQTRAWFHTERRQTIIKVWELAPWYRAVDALRQVPQHESASIADYIEFLLYTGLRRQEAAQLTWTNVDLRDRSLTIPDPKNRSPHVLPLCDRALALLAQRQAVARNQYVFAGTGRLGYLVEPKRQLEKVIAASGVHFSLHDLRRTFITVAESLDVPPYAIKRLVNHKMKNDVTAGYIVSDLERLRAPMQKIADFLGRATGRCDGPPILQFPRAAA